MNTKSLLILTLLTVFCVGNLFAQEKNNQCENFGKENFVGESISLNLQNEDIKVFVNKLTEKVGCKFFIDKSVHIKPLAIKVEDIPWNIVFDNVLKSQDLSWLNKSGRNSKIIFIATKERILCEFVCCWKDNVTSPVWTEFIKVKYLNTTSSNHKTCVSCPEKDSEIISIVKKLLSDKGTVELDKRSNSIIITDIKEKVDLIRKKLEEWDKPETNLEKIVKEFES